MRPIGALGHSADDLTQIRIVCPARCMGYPISMALTTSPVSFKESGVPVSRVPSREWLDFEGDVISGLFAQTESALARRGSSRHENGYHKSDRERAKINSNTNCFGTSTRA
jgi:hypothetical protein